MKDVDVNPDEESPYECFECGTIVLSTDAPGTCPDCAGPMRNRRTPIE
ncbi:rubrerythrin-like domain-containing protein [Haloarchaeobius litoreus]|uniref:Rubrerythrin-like domain-containing protein n=1 Tax=Haloarchaeobius litoreus TaxID=755306 RepID=A0ABD6DQW7_9EURY|nr:rubrerythrin-like domain-containing protein [Haloarchaeobius litoreus]